MTMVVQKLMAITFCLLYFSDIVTGVQYLMGMVIPAQRQLGADIIVAGGGESGSLPLSPRFLERPGRGEGCDGRRGVVRGLLTVCGRRKGVEYKVV